MDVNLYRFVGQMRDAGVADITVTNFSASNLNLSSLVSGSTELGQNVPLPLIQLHQKQDPGYKLVASSVQNTDYLLVATDNIKTLKDLEGKKVGISTPGDISDSLARIALTRANVDISKVTFVAIGGTSARMAGLLADQISAGMAHVAEGLAAIEQGKGKLHNSLTMADALPGYMAQVFILPTRMIAENRALSQALIDGLIDSVRWASTDKEGYLALAKQNIEKPPPPEIMSQAWDILVKSKVFGVNGGISRQSLQQYVEIETATGNLKPPVPPAEQWSDLSLVDDYLQRKGTV
jgi:ABC-type nitrate/sulfonate/bicarbonate transport system substrate-binding protein